MSQKRKRSPDQPSEDELQQPDVYRSAPIEDRSSTFVGLFSPSMQPRDLKSLLEIASASHKMLAWRRESNQQSITGGVKYTTDHDDDGEKYGGKKITKVLENMQVKGVCVVARWYGGVMLGPVRFEHVEKCAVEAIGKWKESVAEERAKKRRTEQEAFQKERLVKVLAERDQSISVLRTLAAEKEAMIKHAKSQSVEKRANGAGIISIDTNAQSPKTGTLSVTPAVDYSIMALERLKAIEKARDATLSFLLKRIDKAEADLATAIGQG